MLGEIVNILAASAMIPIGLFIYYYGTIPIPGHRFRRKWTTRYWRQTDIGRTLMYQKIAWFSFLTLVVVNLFFAPYPGQDLVRFIIYSILIVLFWRVFYTLRKVQKMKPPKYETTTTKDPTTSIDIIKPDELTRETE